MRPLRVEHELLHERVPQAHDGGPLVLRFDLLRVERLSDVAHEHELEDLHHACFGIDLHLGGRRTSSPRRRDCLRADGPAL